MTELFDRASHSPKTQPEAAVAGSLITCSTDEVPPAQRADFWHEDVLRRLDTSGSPHQTRSFRAHLTRLSGDGVEMLQHTGNALVAQRSALRCRRDACDDISIDFIAHTNGSAVVHTGARRVNTGDMIIMDLAQPAKIHRAQHRVISLFIPRARVRTAFGDPAALAGRFLQTNGIPAILRSHMQTTLDQAIQLRPEQRILALAVATELALSILQAQTPGAADVQRFATGFYQAAKILIDRECTNPELTPLHVAGELSCSRAALYRAFAEHGASIAATIWSARVERARRMLISVDCRHLLIGEVAFQCGFSEHSSFDRMFRKRYGMTPREMREVV
jgi:AraC family transcriptional activator of tynA and feaB